MGTPDKIAIHNLFGIEGLDIAWYGILIAAGIVAGVMLAVHEAKRRGYTSELLVDFMILALPLAIIGARIYYVALNGIITPSTPMRSSRSGTAVLRSTGRSSAASSRRSFLPNGGNSRWDGCSIFVRPALF